MRPTTRPCRLLTSWGGGGDARTPHHRVSDANPNGCEAGGWCARGERGSFPSRAAALRCTPFPRTAPPRPRPPAPPFPPHFPSARACGECRDGQTGPQGKPARRRQDGNPETGLFIELPTHLTRVGERRALLGEACRRHPVSAAVRPQNSLPALALGHGTIPVPSSPLAHPRGPEGLRVKAGDPGPGPPPSPPHTHLPVPSSQALAGGVSGR